MSIPLPPTPVTADGDDLLRPILAGSVAGIVGGAIWAGIVALTNYEVGYVAWGIGGLIGVAMGRSTAQRSTQLAAIAAVIAIASLLLGKVLIQHFITRPAFEQSLRDEPDAIGSAAAWRLRDDGGFPPDLQTRYDALGENDTIPDVMWEEMVAAGEEYAASLPEEERAGLADDYVAAATAGIGPWQQLSWGFSLWDLLWLGLAVHTAFRMLQPGEAAKPEEKPA